MAAPAGVLGAGRAARQPPDSARLGKRALISTVNSGHARRWVPVMDLVEDKDDLVLRADLPGLSEDDVDIEVKDGVLTISGERKTEEKKEEEGYYRVERAFGRFSRSLTRPDGIDPDQVKAKFDNGVLEVRIPKPEERKPHRVRIGKGSVEGEGTEKKK
jgi:HSP20 family protein